MKMPAVFAKLRHTNINTCIPFHANTLFLHLRPVTLGKGGVRVKCKGKAKPGTMSEGMRAFMTSQMPKEEIAALSFLNSHPSYDGRGVVIAILDSGVDPAAAGLQVTSDGKPKILDILDCTGSGDIDTSKVVEADDDGYIVGASGARLMVNKSWKNPSREWRVGYKFVYELFTETLIARLKKERKKKWEEKHAEATLDAFKKLTAFDQKHPKPDNHTLKKEREDLQNRVDYLKKQASTYEDKGPVIDAVVWNDGDVWRAAFDTQDLEEDAECGKVANFTPLTNYRTENKYGVFSRLDACTFSVNIYNNGSILSVVTDCSPHGTHVAGITAAYHPEEPLLNGIAPGAQLVSCKIGDSRLGSMETGTGLTRALIAVLEVAETRFASHIIVLRRLVQVKDALQGMVISNNWGVWKQKNTERANKIKERILADSWWERVGYLLKITEPIMSMLRYADMDRPCLGEIYDGIDSMIEKIKQVINEQEQDPQETFFKQVQKIINERWNKITTPLHLLAYALTPKYYSSQYCDLPGRLPPYRDMEVSDGYQAAFRRIFPDDDIRDVIMDEFIAFVNATGLSNDALRHRFKKHAHGWWYLHGQKFRTLQPLAIKVISQNKCDLINMSYGEGTMLPDYGRFIELANEVVNKYGVIFVSSAGNSGPSLSTVTAPGGTSSSIIGIGAYVSPAMAAAAHCVVEPPAEGLEYTWSSRGPTVDGDLGVCLSAPGGAVAPVPTWTLQRRMLMNGTSMASPCACGGVALLLSAMKAECFTISPYTVRKALENTAAAIGNDPEEKLSTGQGLMQIDKAFEYLKQCNGMPSVWYQVQIKKSGNSGASMRGIYLREAYECRQTSEWTVQVKPNFHEDADKLKLLVPFEECIQIKSSNAEVVKAPEYILLTHNGRSFNILVDPTSLSEGLHYFEVYGIDCNAPWRGPLFRVPVTVMKPLYIKKDLPAISLSGLPFVAGHIERRFIEVPIGSTWIEATMRASGFDTPRKFFINSVQICPKCRPIQWGSFVTFTSPSLKSFAFRVENGRTIEITIAEFWSSGNGSHMKTIVDLEIEFHGIMGNKEDILLSSSEAPTKIDVKAFSTETLAPTATLTKVRVPYWPVESVLLPLPTTLDKLPSGAQIYGLTLTYKFTLAEESDVSAHVPLLNNRIYDTEFESQFYMIADTNKRILGIGDVYPKATKLPKGDYTLRFLLRHDNTNYLEKLKKMILFIERNLEKKSVIGLSFYSHPDGPVTGADSFNSTLLASGETQALYISPPADDKIPKDCSAGALLIGEITYGKLSLGNKKGEQNGNKCPASSEISYMVPPAAKGEEKEKEKNSANSKISLELRLEQAVRDSKLKILSSLPKDTVEEYDEWRKLATTLKLQYPQDTELLSSILGGLVSMSLNEENKKHQKEIIDTANEIINSIDRDALAKYFSMKSESEDMDADETKKKMEAQREWLAEAYYRKGLALEKIDSLKEKKVETDDNPVASPESSDDREKIVSPSDVDDTKDLFEENYEEFRKWADVFSPKYGFLTIVRERRSKRLGTALKVLSKILEDKSKPPQKKLYKLKLALIEEMGWNHLVSYEKDWMLTLFPSDYPLF